MLWVSIEFIRKFLKFNLAEQVSNEIISPVIYAKFFDQMQVCKIPKLEQGPLIDKQISTLWVS